MKKYGLCKGLKAINHQDNVHVCVCVCMCVTRTSVVGDGEQWGDPACISFL